MEHRYESDMTKKEKRSREKEKLKNLNFKGKAEYIWMYYKVWLVVLAIGAALIYTGISMYQGSRENVLLNIAIAGGDSQNTETLKALEQEVKGWLNSSGKYDTVRVQANIPADADSMAAQTTLTTLIGANAVDILICPEDIYHQYAGQGGFRDNTLILINEEQVKEKFGVTYDNIYIGTPVNAEHKENAEIVMDKISEYSEN